MHGSGIEKGRGPGFGVILDYVMRPQGSSLLVSRKAPDGVQ